MKRTFSQLCLVLLLLSFAATALSDRGVEEQKAKLLDLIVESEDPEVRKKLLGIYESLGTSATGSSQPKRATSKFSGPLSEDEVKEFELLMKARAKCGSSKQKLKAKFGQAGENYYVKTSWLEGKPFTYTYNQLKDNSYPSSREKEIHKHHYFLEKSCFERAVGQVSAAAVEKSGFASFWAEFERIQDSFLKGNLTFGRRYELETSAMEKLKGILQASHQNVLQGRKAQQAAATREKEAKQAAVIKECEDNGGGFGSQDTLTQN